MTEKPASPQPTIERATPPITSEAADAEERLRAEFVPATLRQKIYLAAILIAATAVVIVIWFRSYENLRSLSDTPVAVNWRPGDSQALRAANGGLRYDAEKGQLLMAGIPDAGRFEELSKLLVDKQSGDPVKPSMAEAYWTALSDLAFEARAQSGRARSALLLIAALSGVLGVMMRSLADYIGNACFLNRLDVRRWWPWYALRVPLGFLVGLTVLILAESGWVSSEGRVASGAVWWLGIAMLAGYGTAEFLERLRLLSRTVFGEK